MWLSKSHSRTALAYLASVTPCVPAVCFAPAMNRTIAGTIAHSSGTAIANAKVTTPEKPTAFLYQSNAHESGDDALLDLPPGKCKRPVESTGFKAAARENTDNFHGSLFESLQNNNLNSRSCFQDLLGHLSHNCLGGSVAGPVKKDKRFTLEAIWTQTA